MNTQAITLDSRRMAELPIYEGGYRLSEHLGSACFLDPPGYPTYFIQSVYNSRGDSPEFGTQAVIKWVDGTYRTVESTSRDVDGDFRANMRGLWVPLPYDHARTQAWIQYVYAYFRNCYAIPGGSKNASDLIIWPEKSVFLKYGEEKWQFVGDFKFYDFLLKPESRNYLTKIWKENRVRRKKAGKLNSALLQKIKSVICIENYRAFQYICEFYPEHADYIEYAEILRKSPPAWGSGGVGDWWERNNDNTCARSHTEKAKWCQYCGWVYKPESEPALVA